MGGSLRRLAAGSRVFERVTVEVAGCRMTARRSVLTPAADEPVVVLVAGLGLSGRYLVPVGVELARRFQVWIPDLPGFGRSDAPEEALDVPGLGGTVIAWMDRVELDRVALVGNSMGCQIAVEAAAQHPDRVSHLVLEGPTMDSGARTVPRHLLRIARDALREPASLGPLQVIDWIGTGPRRIAGTTRHAFAHRIEERVADVTAPTMVVRGSQDPIVPQRWAAEVTAGLPNGTLRLVRGASHTMTYSDPETLADAVADFVTRWRPTVATASTG